MSLSSADISVIVPCLNAEATLGEALESVFAQTAPPREVLLIDDRSTDRSIEIARRFGPAVRVFLNPGHGPGWARRLGVHEARGRYIAFVDADDILAPDKHERQLAVFAQHGPRTVVHTGASLFLDQPGRPSRPRESGGDAVGCCTRMIFERNPVCGASSMLERDVVLELGNYDPRLVGTEDYGMSLAASTCCRFFYLPEPLYHIRRHAGNLTNRKAHMVYHHWLAQEMFRLRFPAAFGALPAACVRQAMIEPVLRAVQEAYWRREPAGYARLLRLAMRIAPGEPAVQRLWQRRWCPMTVLRRWDRLMERVRPAPSLPDAAKPTANRELLRCAE